MISDRLTAILRERYETGAHGNAFLMMSKATTEAFAASASLAPPRLPRVPPPAAAGRLWDVPVVLDAALPDGVWRLLDRSTGEEIEHGVSDVG